MPIESVFRSCMNIFYSLYDITQPLLDLLNGGYIIGGEFYSLFDIIFGVGLPAFMGFMILKWLLPGG